MPGLLNQSSFSWSRLSVWFIAIVYGWVFFNFSSWKGNHVIEWDAFEYYLYLPSVFVHHSFDLDWAMPELHKIGDPFHWDFLSPTGKPVGRMSMGLALLYTPFFLMGHLWAKLSGATADGFSAPYYFFMLLGTVLYAVAANVLLAKVLKRWFADVTCAYTLLALNLGTNLFYFVTTAPLLTHVVNFFLFAAFLFLTIRWYERKDFLTSLLVGHTGAMIVLVRPTNAVGLFLFLLWEVNSFISLKQRALLFMHHYKQVLWMALSGVLVFLPQLFYWKMQTGQWYYYSYGFLGAFYFDSPHLWDGLFSYRKGWLLYTPLMAFALAGFFWLKNYVPGVTRSLIFIAGIHFYVVVSFWCWWYGAGFGLRPMIDIYPLLALPLAACIERANTKKVRLLMLPVLVLLMLINQFQTYQARKNAIHFDSMTRAYYWTNFLRLDRYKTTTHLLRPPDYFEAVKNREQY